jgi:hypothetical protein
MSHDQILFLLLAPGQPEPEKDYAESARGPINFSSRAGERLVIDEPRSGVCRATIDAVLIGSDDVARGKPSITKSSAYCQNAERPCCFGGIAI